MGLAASQARFLGLTARKSNTEYKVQQINQARTALSNEVMGLYEKYNNLDVPTPPLVTDYMKTTSTINTPYESYNIDSFTKITSGQYAGYYDVNLSWEDEIPKAYTYAARDSVITAQKGTNGYSYLNFQLGVDSYTYDENDPDGSTITKIDKDYERFPGLTTIMQAQGLTSGTFYMFTRGNTSYFTSENDLDSTAFETVNGKNQYYGTYTFDYQGVQKTSNSTVVKAALTQESNGRLGTIQIIESPDLPEMTGSAFSIDTAQEEDTMAYQDAMNNYEYEKMLYEREVEKINKKTEEIQEQDRSLELEINELDTEQNAIATEMDSVKKVIEDTVEAVFKTFSG